MERLINCRFVYPGLWSVPKFRSKKGKERHTGTCKIHRLERSRTKKVYFCPYYYHQCNTPSTLLTQVQVCRESCYDPYVVYESFTIDTNKKSKSRRGLSLENLEGGHLNRSRSTCLGTGLSSSVRASASFIRDSYDEVDLISSLCRFPIYTSILFIIIKKNRVFVFLVLQSLTRPSVKYWYSSSSVELSVFT